LSYGTPDEIIIDLNAELIQPKLDANNIRPVKTKVAPSKMTTLSGFFSVLLNALLSMMIIIY
jgi:hypothetical protein